MVRHHLATALTCALFCLVTGVSSPVPKPLTPKPIAATAPKRGGDIVRFKSLQADLPVAAAIERPGRPATIQLASTETDARETIRFARKQAAKSIPANSAQHETAAIKASIASPPAAGEEKSDLEANEDDGLSDVGEDQPDASGDDTDAEAAGEDAEEDLVEAETPPLSHEEMCQVLHAAAQDHELPVALFTRLIWQESRFRPRVVSPVGARGIAQFMPGTAAERGLEDPFDPMQALPASAGFLRELVDRFGNFGLAAAAYNGGPRRVSEWLAGKGGLPRETREYVVHITGQPAEHWAEAATYAEPLPEAIEVEDCRVKPLRAARAALKMLAKMASATKTAKKETEREKEKEKEKDNAAKTAKKETEKEKEKEKEKDRLAWGVQLAGNWSEDKALAAYASLQKKYPKVLGKRKPSVVKMKTAGKNTTQKTLVRVAAATKSDAEDICKQLKSAGGSCTVLKISA